MHASTGKILLIDEDGFARICSSILETEGFEVEAINSVQDNWPSKLKSRYSAMVILSYPYGKFALGELRKLVLPVLILTDHVSEEIISLLEGFDKSFCMVKPLDYIKFKLLVRQLMNGDKIFYADKNIV